MAEFSSLFFFGFTLLLTVVLHKRADIMIGRPQYLLYDMERIDDGHSVREIFVDICQVGIIHISQKIFNGAALCRRYGSKVRFCDISPPATEEINYSLVWKSWMTRAYLQWGSMSICEVLYCQLEGSAGKLVLRRA